MYSWKAAKCYVERVNRCRAQSRSPAPVGYGARDAGVAAFRPRRQEGLQFSRPAVALSVLMRPPFFVWGTWRPMPGMGRKSFAVVPGNPCPRPASSPVPIVESGTEVYIKW